MKRADSQLTKGERTAQRILDAAETLISARGYRATTVREIAQAAGIQEPGLYNHFKSKERLFSAMLDRALQPLAVAIEQQANRAPATESLPGLISDLLAQHPNIPTLFQQALMAPNDNPGHEQLINWLQKLMGNADTLLPGTSESSNIHLLHMVAMFNVVSGYFTANTLIQTLSGKDVLDTSLLKEQQKLAEDLAAFLLHRKHTEQNPTHKPL